MKIPFFGPKIQPSSERQLAEVLNRMRAEGKSVPDFNQTGGWEYVSGNNWTYADRWRSANDMWRPMTIPMMEQAYSQNPIVRACVQEIATSCAQPRLEIGTMNSKGVWKAVNAHPLLDTIEKPNRYYSQADFIQAHVSRLLLTGMALTWKWRNGARTMATELWPVPTSWVTPILGTGGDLYQGFKIHGQRDVIPYNDVIFTRFTDPATSNRFSSPLQSCIRDYVMDQERENYLLELMTNMKLPGLIIENKKPMSDMVRDRMRDDLESRVGKGRRGNTLLLEGEITATVNAPLADFDWPSMTGLLEARICMAFGVPPIIIHARIGLERSTYANYKEARAAFYHETMAPLWELLADSLTLTYLRSEGEEDLVVRFRYDELPEFQDNATELSARIVAQYAAGLITDQEAREKLGYSLVPASGEFKAPPPVSITSSSSGNGNGNGSGNPNDNSNNSAPDNTGADQLPSDTGKANGATRRHRNGKVLV